MARLVEIRDPDDFTQGVDVFSRRLKRSGLPTLGDVMGTQGALFDLGHSLDLVRDPPPKVKADAQ